MGIPPLHELNFGHKFSKWRPQQVVAIQQALDVDERFLVQVQPTGSGKTLCYVTAAKLRTGRTLILTSFKGLQEQLRRDFNLFVLMGRGAYRCKKDAKHTCEEGACRTGGFCAYGQDKSASGCRYNWALRYSATQKIVVTNYSFWLSNKHKWHDIGPFDYLVCDEAHIIPNYALDFMGVTVRPNHIKDFVTWPERHKSFSFYHAWLKQLYSKLSSKVRSIKNQYGEAKDRSSLVKLHRRLSRIPLITSDNWVIEHTGGMIKAGAIQPTDIVQTMLFGTIPKVLLTSATIDRGTCKRIGLDNKNSVYTEYHSTFPVKQRPVYTIPCVRVDFRMTDVMIRRWLDLMDAYIGDRLGINGIIHGISYDRCKYILENSKYRELMMTHTSKGTQKAVELFKKCTDKCILVSPSVVTGWDFPYDECRWQIICKVPFPDLRSSIDQARKAKNPDLGNLLAIQNIVQICGRGMRYADDTCETLIVDDHFRWFYNKTSHWAPEWFRESVEFISVLPEPL